MRIKKNILTLMLLIMSSFGFSQKFIEDKLKIQHVLDSLNISLNKPVPPEGFTLFYNCDSFPFMKKINGDTISIYTKGGSIPLYYASKYESDNFLYYLSHPDTSGVSYLSGFYYDGRIIHQYLSLEQFVFANDSLFSIRFNDDEYTKIAMNSVFEQAFGGLDSLKATKKINQARKKYKGFWEKNLVFTKSMFTVSNEVKINSLHDNYPSVVKLLKKWEENEIEIFHIALITYTSSGESVSEYIFDEKMNFIEWENCEK